MSGKNPFLVSAEELSNKLGSSCRIVDGSWYLPAQNRDARAEFAKSRIPGAVFFDIDEIADKNSDLPHMLPSPEEFAEAAGALGISHNDEIIVYDGPGIFSAARVWWTFRVMGANNVRILEGGFDRWQKNGFSVETGDPEKPQQAVFNTSFDPTKIRNLEAMKANLKNGKAAIVDARPFNRFTGEAAEPREGLRSGHMPGSLSLPAGEVLREGTLLPVAELKKIFTGLHISEDREVITSCGSGVTAAILSLALESAGHENHSLYDGSWAEWGAGRDLPVVTWDETGSKTGDDNGYDRPKD